jgi:hypothetical protein
VVGVIAVLRLSAGRLTGGPNVRDRTTIVDLL